MRIAVLIPEHTEGKPGGISSAQKNLYDALISLGEDEVRAFYFRDSRSASLIDRLVWLLIKGLCRVAFLGISFTIRSYQLADTLIGMWGGFRVGSAISSFEPDLILSPDKGLPFLLFPKRSSKIVLFSHHNAIRFLESDKHASHADIKLAVLFERCSLRKVDSVFCPSVYMHECFRRTHRYNGPIEVFPNIMSQEIARGGGSLRLRLGLSPEDPIFYLPSGGTSVKGSAFLAEILLELGIRYSRYGVYISGKIEPDAAKALTDAPSGASIYSPGSLGREENLQLVSDCDVCITAATHESFGMAILEALFMGVPVAAFRIEAIPEIVSADTGNLVDFGDVEALCAAAADLWVKFKSGVWSKALVSKNALTRYQDATDIRYLREKFLRLMQR